MNENELIESGASIYEEAMLSGMTKQESKEMAYATVDGLWELRQEPAWANAIQAVDRKIGAGKFAPKPANGYAATEAKENGAELFESALGFSRYMFGRWCSRRSPKVGDVFEFSPFQWLDVYQAATGKTLSYPQSFVNEFYPSQKHASQLQKAGWVFDFKQRGETYAVTIVAIPKSEKDIERERLETEAASIRRQLDDLMTRIATL